MADLPEQPDAGRPLRVLHLVLAADAGGLTRYVTTLAAAMRGEGHAVYAAGDDGAWRAAFDEAGVPYERVPLKAGLRGLRQSARHLRGWLREREVDVLHAHYRRATLLGRRLQRGLPRDRRPPLLYTLHLSHINVGGWRRWVSDFGDHTHAASRDAVDWLVSDARVPPARVTLIPHGIDVSRFPRRTDADRRDARRRLGVPEDALVAAFVGRLDDPKNEQWCADVLLPARRPAANLWLVYAGEGPRERELREHVARAGVADRVRILRQAPPLPVYQASDLILLPSAREGFSLVVAEAMSVGVPHVRTRTAGTHELTIEGRTGVSTPIDRAAFAGAAAALLGEPGRLPAMGEAGAALIRERFTFERQVAETVGLYRRLIAGRP